MKSVETLIDAIKAYNPGADEALIRCAYDFGRAAHTGQYRKSGEPYFCHPIEVALLLTEVRIDDATIVTALLHDTIEDTPVTYEDVAQMFSEEIATLVNGVTKLTKLDLREHQSAEVENLRKLFMAMSKDVRVLLVKLADRLHNMTTISAMKPEGQRKKARETMDIYAPLAGRMGMQALRERLEDLSFEVLNPMARASILKRFEKMHQETGDLVPQIIEDIEKELAAIGVEARVMGRQKKPYSVWRKIRAKGESFTRLSDIYGFRIITTSIEDCYRALGAVHQRWSAVPGRFKDYISQPKSNGYRSIHTTVSGRKGKRVEIQIRSQEMHLIAQSGVAAHWSYRDGAPIKNSYLVDPLAWISSLAEDAEDYDADEFFEHFKLEMYSDQVFVFSPKGKVISLPRGATALDFAYAIHTKVGNSAVGARVDGATVPLSRELRNGNMVYIVTSEGNVPVEGAVAMVKTGRAKSAIRRAIRSEQREGYITQGREIVRVAFERIEKKATDRALEAAAEVLGLDSVDTLLAQLGSSVLTGRQVIAALYPELLTENTTDSKMTAQPFIGLTPAYASRPGRCCLPVPGERIVGIAKKGEGIVYHNVDCDTLARFEDGDDGRWLDLRWPDDVDGATFPTMIAVTMINDAGVLGRICTLIGENHANIEDLVFTDKEPDFYTVRFQVAVRDAEHLHNILMAVHAENFVSNAWRVRFKPVAEDSQASADDLMVMERPHLRR